MNRSSGLAVGPVSGAPPSGPNLMLDALHGTDTHALRQLVAEESGRRLSAGLSVSDDALRELAGGHRLSEDAQRGLWLWLRRLCARRVEVAEGPRASAGAAPRRREPRVASGRMAAVSP